MYAGLFGLTPWWILMFSPLFFSETQVFFHSLFSFLSLGQLCLLWLVWSLQGMLFILLNFCWALPGLAKNLWEGLTDLFSQPETMSKASMGCNIRMLLPSTAALHCVTLSLPFLLGHLSGYLKNRHFLVCQRMVPYLAHEKQKGAPFFVACGFNPWVINHSSLSWGFSELLVESENCLFVPCMPPCFGIVTWCPDKSRNPDCSCSLLSAKGKSS